MKKTLLIKMLRDIRQNIVQFIAIFVMCFFAMFVLASLDSFAFGASETVNRYFADTDYTDIVLRSEGFTEGDKTSVLSLREVENVQLKAYRTGKVLFPDKEKKIGMNFIQEDTVSRLYLIEGEPYEPGMSGIWIDPHFAEKEHISVGDTMNLRYENVIFSEKVMGIMDSPDCFYYMVDDTYTEPQYGDYCYAYMDVREYPGKTIKYERMNVKLNTLSRELGLTDDDLEALEHAKLDILNTLTKSSLAVITKQNEIGYSQIWGDVESNQILTTAFPPLFILVALLGVMTTMTRLMARQRMLIGALKALGFSRRTIMAHYMSYIALISLVGCLIGSLVGYNTLGRSLSEDMDLYYSNPYNDMAITPRMIYMNLLIVVFACIIAYLSCRKLLVQNASEILRPEPPATAGAGFLEKTPIWGILSFATKWNVRDISRNRLRTVMGILGVTLCSALMLASFGYNESLGNGGEWEYSELKPAAYQITVSDEANAATAYDYAKQYDGQLVMNQEVEMKTAKVDRMYQLVVPDKGNLFRFEDEDFHYLQLPEDGVLISAKAAQVMHAQVGERIRFRLPGKKTWASVRIVGVYKSEHMQGIAMSRRVFQSLGMEFDPKFIYTNRTVEESLVERKEIAAVTSREKSIHAVKLANMTMEDVVVAIMMVAVVVGIVVTYNMGVLSFMEKIREIATLKVLGFPTKRIRWILLQQSIVITGLGTILGMPLGVELLKALMDFPEPTSDYVLQMTSLPFICAFALSFGLSVVVNLFLTSKVRDIDMVEALKGVE